MADYRVPREDMQFVLQEVFRVQDDWAQCAQLADLDIETAVAIIDESAKLAEGLIAPNARAADEQGVRFSDGVVTTPAGYKENFQQLAAGGWVGVTANPEYGGMGPTKINFSAIRRDPLRGRHFLFTLSRPYRWRHYDA